MLANEKWDQKPLSENGQILMDAANYMDEHGWCQKHASEPNGSVCFYGAIAAVVGAVSFVNGNVNGNFFRIDKDNPNFKRFAAIQHLVETSRTFISGAAEWNDYAAKSKEEVVAKLRELAYLF